MAEYKARQKSFVNSIVKSSNPFLKSLPKSRNTSLGNKVRQLEKFSEGIKLSPRQRYWRWASLNPEKSTEKLMVGIRKYPEILLAYRKRKAGQLKNIHKEGNFNEVLLTDMNLVLQNDMLVKVDLMSMANSLEVRSPFLDFNVVNYVFSLPVDYKIDQNHRKKILKDAFKMDLPAELYGRKKQGFEVPLLKWFRTELRSMIEDDLLNDKFIEEQGIFSVDEIRKIKQQLFSINPNDTVAQVWGLIVFQFWWKKYMS